MARHEKEDGSVEIERVLSLLKEFDAINRHIVSVERFSPLMLNGVVWSNNDARTCFVPSGFGQKVAQDGPSNRLDSLPLYM